MSVDPLRERLAEVDHRLPQVAHLVAQVLEVPGRHPLDDDLGRPGAPPARPQRGVDVDPGLLGDEGEGAGHVERRGERVQTPDCGPDPRRVGGGEAGGRLQRCDGRLKPAGCLAVALFDPHADVVPPASSSA
ncbi:MAG: hypothetical protein E6G66_03370 [Actinobacteria bacterium]|nr:MAG: hypothetical protein E6G66_03370 [Actinomycetota bacterium]